MRDVMPSQVVAAIDELFPHAKKGMTDGKLDGSRSTQLRGVLDLVEAIPAALLPANSSDYSAFVLAKSTIKEALRVTGKPMHYFPAGSLLMKMHGFTHTTRGLDDPRFKLVIPVINHEEMKTNIAFIILEFEKLEPTGALASARAMESIVLNDFTKHDAQSLPTRDPTTHASKEWMVLEGMPKKKWIDSTKEMVGRFQAEMDARKVCAISIANTKYLAPSAMLFGPEVFTAFPSAADDISEAGACLSFGRGTACVMHSMRALEVALQAWADAVSVKKQNNWGAYIREFDRELEKRKKAPIPGMSNSMRRSTPTSTR